MKPIYAEIITIGDEILYGQITDTNSQWISEELNKIGIKIIRKSSVGDEKNEILSILAEAEKRATILIITGGLGPTNDDITKKTLAEYFNTELKLNHEALEDVTNFFKKRGKELTEINRQQAFLPEKCVCLRNLLGTAPGMWFSKDEKVFVSLPGVPYEMKTLMREDVLPRFTKKFHCPIIHHRMIKTVGIGESYLAEKIKDWEDQLPKHMKLAYLPSFGEVRLRITSVGTDEKTLIQETNQQVDSLLKIAGEYIFGFGEDTLALAIGKLLKSKKLSIATAESCSGGYAGHMITSVPGSSEYYLGGVIAYDNKVKNEILGVQNTTLETFGAVSEETAIEMASGIRLRLKTDIGISSTGIAGPGGGSEEKPVGTIWIAYSDKSKSITKKLTLGGNREINIKLTAIHLLNLVRMQLND